MARSTTCPDCNADISQQKFGSRFCMKCYNRRRRMGIPTSKYTQGSQPQLLDVVPLPPPEKVAVTTATTLSGGCIMCGKRVWRGRPICFECYLEDTGMEKGASTMVQRIYVLVDPRDDVVKYCGVTQQSLATRLSMHLSSVTAGKETPVYRWLRELRELNLKPEIRLVEETEDREREVYWIAYFRERGLELHNMDDGAGFGRETTDDTRQKQSAAHEGKPLSAAHRAAQAEGHRESASGQHTDDEEANADSVDSGGERLYRGFNRTKKLTDQQLAGFRALAQQIEADDRDVRELPEG